MFANFQFPNTAFRFAKASAINATMRHAVNPHFDLVDIRLLINIADASSKG